jgi:hypothetical protein
MHAVLSSEARLPEVQATQSAEMALLTNPLSQCKHAEAATPLYVPAAQLTHMVWSNDARLPGVQASQ